MEAKYHQWLEAHEDYDIDYETGEVNIKQIIPLCHSCHNFIHSGRLWMVNHVGIKHRCTSISLGDVDIADWDEWHLVLEGEKYYSKFKNYEEWEEFYSEK